MPDIPAASPAAPRPGPDVIGVGYEGHDIGSFIGGLLAARVRRVADVRLNAVSRKQGFSKRALAAELAQAGIGYQHFRELGNPRWNRDGFAGPPSEVWAARARFSEIIGVGAADALIAEIAAAAAGGVVAVMCVEADDSRCHRYVILDRVRGRVRSGRDCAGELPGLTVPDSAQAGNSAC